METKYDAIIIGTGHSGPSLAASLAGAGMNVAIIVFNVTAATEVYTGTFPLEGD